MPPFPTDRPLIVFDGVCVLCSAFARFVVRHDGQARFLFTAAQSNLGQALLRHCGLDPVDFETNLVIADGRIYTRLAAFHAVLDRFGGGWRLLTLMRFLPRPAQDWLYDRIAKNRYRLFGRTEACVVPDAAWRDRLIG